MTLTLSLESPFPSRFMAWVNERFQLPNALLFFVLYASALLFGRALVGDGVLHVAAPDVAGFFAVWAFFLMLRVFDEHKDFELDAKNHPKRVLQSGLITLGHLKVAGAIAIALQLGVSLWRDGGAGRVTIAWAIAMGWSALMAKEFFVGEWLSKRLVLYAFSHMLVMPLALMWMAQMGAGAAQLPAPVANLAVLSFFSGAAFEIARKTKAPEDERDTVDSYTRSWGLRGAPIAVLVVLVIGTVPLDLALVWLYGDAKAVPLVAWCVLGASIVLPAIAVVRFLAKATPKNAKMIEATVGTSMLVAYVTLIACIVGHRGVTWQ
jgi:4-hydroxybenzoate polyprenyltransferase